MKKILLSLLSTFYIITGFSQANVYPAPPQKGTIALTNARIHVGNGNIIENGMVVFEKGKITKVGMVEPAPGAEIIDCKGKEIYPGLINANTNLGLNEIGAVRSTRDDYELGELNPNVRAVVAYNTDSKIINTLKVNGILFANVIPSGGLITGSSSVMQLDAWNWEDAVYQMDEGIHLRMPNFMRYSQNRDPLEDALKKLETVKTFFNDAKAYLSSPSHVHTNLKFESVKGLFDGSQKLFIHADLERPMMEGVELARQFGFKPVIIGGSDSWKITGYLKENNVPVILSSSHSLPNFRDDDVDLPYKTPYLLQQAGLLYCISDPDDQSRYRNLAFNAGTATGYGLTKEEALTAITLNAAKILGIDSKTGSIEVGKDANIVVSDGDILDMRTNKVAYAFIQGRTLDLGNKQQQLYDRYMHKYGLEEGK